MDGVAQQKNFALVKLPFEKIVAFAVVFVAVFVLSFAVLFEAALVSFVVFAAFAAFVSLVSFAAFSVVLVDFCATVLSPFFCTHFLNHFLINELRFFSISPVPVFPAGPY